MEKDDSMTIILICVIIVVILAIIAFSLRISSKYQKKEKTVAQQTTTTQTNEIKQNNGTQNIKTNTDETEYNKHSTNNNSVIIGVLLVLCILVVIPVISYWKIYVDNGESGFASIIPIYSQMVLYRIVGLKEWYVFLALVPVVGTMISTIISMYATFLLGQKYNKNFLFICGMIFLPFIFLPLLAKSELPRKYNSFYDNY